jgi:hypothetical protein
MIRFCLYLQSHGGEFHSGYAMQIREKIARLVDRDRWRSVRSVAERAGVDDSTMTRVRNTGVCAVGKAIAIARALDVPVDWLFDDAMDWPPPPADNAAPPIAIQPWPPLGITWPEVKLAIARYIAERTEGEVAEMLTEAGMGLVDDPGVYDESARRSSLMTSRRASSSPSSPSSRRTRGKIERPGRRR